MQSGNPPFPASTAPHHNYQPQHGQQQYTSHQQQPQYAPVQVQQQQHPPPLQQIPKQVPVPQNYTQRNKNIGNIEDEVLVPQTPDEETEDGRVRNREAITKIRDIWIYKQVRARQDEFTQYRPVRIFMHTLFFFLENISSSLFLFLSKSNYLTFLSSFLIRQFCLQEHGMSTQKVKMSP